MLVLTGVPLAWAQQMVRTQNAKMLHELLDAKLVVIEDCGHMLNLESPERYRAPPSASLSFRVRRVVVRVDQPELM